MHGLTVAILQPPECVHLVYIVTEYLYYVSTLMYVAQWRQNVFESTLTFVQRKMLSQQCIKQFIYPKQYKLPFLIHYNKFQSNSFEA